MNQVHVRFRTHKQVVRHIETESAAKVAHEVVRGSVVLAAAAAAWRHVEARVLAPYPRHQLRGHAIGNGKVRQPNAIEVIKEGPEGHRLEGSRDYVLILAGPPRQFGTDPEIVPDEEVRADARRQAASYGLLGIAA